MRDPVDTAMDAAEAWLDSPRGAHDDGTTALLVATLQASIKVLRERHALLPVLRTCGGCAHYADVRDGQCEHPGLDDFRDIGRNDAPPSWCPLRANSASMRG